MKKSYKPLDIIREDQEKLRKNILLRPGDNLKVSRNLQKEMHKRKKKIPLIYADHNNPM